MKPGGWLNQPVERTAYSQYFSVLVKKLEGRTKRAMKNEACAKVRMILINKKEVQQPLYTFELFLSSVLPYPPVCIFSPYFFSVSQYSVVILTSFMTTSPLTFLGL